MRLILLCALFAGIVKADQLLFESLQSASSEKETIVCPDQNSKCSKESTCCQMANGQWGCCPFARASCCSDQVHCCPQGYSCNADKGQCIKAINNATIPWAVKQPSTAGALTSSSPSNGLTCADGSVCAGNAACCRTYSGSFRCCAYPNDVCCSNGLSCCPRCTICDFVNNRCISGFATEEWKPLTKSIPSEAIPAGVKTPALFTGDALKKQTALEASLEFKHCNSTVGCQDYQTCCLGAGYIWVCCPFTPAQCCTGSNYCCPWGKRCSNPPGLCY